MFQNRSDAFEPRISSIAGHLRAIEKEIGALGISAGRRTSAGASGAGNQIVETLGPILNDILDRFRRGQRVAIDEGVSFGNEAVKLGVRAGSDAFGRIATQAKQRPLATLAVAIGVGILIGVVSRRG
jgi:hypothetical protein